MRGSRVWLCSEWLRLGGKKFEEYFLRLSQKKQGIQAVILNTEAYHARALGSLSLPRSRRRGWKWTEWRCVYCLWQSSPIDSRVWSVLLSVQLYHLGPLTFSLPVECSQWKALAEAWRTGEGKEPNIFASLLHLLLALLWFCEWRTSLSKISVCGPAPFLWPQL